MRTKLARATVAVFLLFSGHTAFAQFGLPSETYDPFQIEDSQSWNMSFSNYNVWENNVFYDRIDNHFFSAQNSDKPIDEIVVRAKRRAAHRMFLADLYAQMDWYILSLVSSAQVSACQMTAGIDPGTVCSSEQNEAACITTSYSVAALSQGQADELNASYTQLQAIDSAAHSMQVGGLTAIFTGGLAPAAAVLTSLVATTGSFVASLPDRNHINPFAAGDSFELTMTSCPSTDGFSTPSSTVSVQYTAG